MKKSVVAEGQILAILKQGAPARRLLLLIPHQLMQGETETPDYPVAAVRIVPRLY